MEKLEEMSYDELLEIYQEEVNFVSYLEEMYQRTKGEEDE